MLNKLIEWCVENRFLVCILMVIVTLIGVWSMATMPIDAIPDLSDVQVIIYTPWQGRDPQTMEDQVTYPISSRMLNVPKVRDVRGYSFFGFSFVYVIFQDGTDPYWARSRVLEYLSQVQRELPAGAAPSLGPDASGLGWVFIYTLEDTKGKLDLGQLRSLQDYYVRYQLTSVPGVAEVASVGGAVRQYQVTVDPYLLASYNMPLKKIIMAIKRSNNDVGGRVVEMAETEYMLRGRGYIQSIEDIEKIAVGADENGTPILLRDLATIEIGPDIKRGIAEKNGEGEVVAGIVTMRYGENALAVIERVKKKIAEIQPGLPDGVVIRRAYDRSGLIHRSIRTLGKQLLEELGIVALVCILFLWHARSALVSAVSLPLGILVSFIIMRAMGINANIMSLGGIAVAIGAMVDAAVVMVENLHKHKEHDPEGTDHWQQVINASKEVGPALFFSLLVITVSFVPVFALQQQAGRLFKPLAFTKTFAMASSAVLAVILMPILMGFFIRGKVHPESENPLSRLMIWIYLPFLRFALKYRKTCIAIAIALLAFSWLPYSRFGSEFMPPIREGDILFMPTTVPGLSSTEARRTLQIQDRLLAEFPEVETVLGKIGRADTPLDPAPLSMVETHVSLRPENEWPERIIEKGYLKEIALRMLEDLKSMGFVVDVGVTSAGVSEESARELTPMKGSGTEGSGSEGPPTKSGSVPPENDIASQTERMSRSELTRVIRERFIKGESMKEILPGLPTMLIRQVAADLKSNLVTQHALTEQGESSLPDKLIERWDKRIRPEDLPLRRTNFAELTKSEMNQHIRIPGMPNWWLMPIETRIGMLTTGMRGVLGLKVYGTDLNELQRLGTELEPIIKSVPGTVSVVAERALGGNYLDIDIDRKACARYGLTIGDVQDVIETGIGGMNLTSTIEGRYRFPLNLRYSRELRDDPVKLARVLIPTPRGEQIPLGQLAEIRVKEGPPMIKSENGLLLINIPVDLEQGVDIGSYVKRAQGVLDKAIAGGELNIPPGYYTTWSGQYQFMLDVNRRLKIIIPITLAIIFILIYLNMHNITETLITMVTLPFALVGGIWYMHFLGYNLSVAVGIGFIALAGLAAETAIIMHVYLELACKKRERDGAVMSHEDLNEAVIEGAALRVRPKMMTVMTTIMALLPIMWATGAGSGPMKRMAAPMIGGLISSTIHTLILIPVYYAMFKEWQLSRKQTGVNIR